jgi:hypothetical protein
VIFDEHDHARLATLFDGVAAEHRHTSESPFFCDYCGQQTHALDGRDLGVDCPKHTPYPGYKPEVREAPNGDTKACPECERDGRPMVDCRVPGCNGSGRVPNVDAEGVCGVCKGAQYHEDDCIRDRPGMFLELCGCLPNPFCPGCSGTGRAKAKRYLHVAPKHNPPAWAMAYLARAHYEACRVAEALNVPAAYYPRVADGTLRVLEYPPGAGTVEHTDFNLFTIVLWRSTPDDLECTDKNLLAGEYTTAACQYWRLSKARKISPGLHIGELGELVGLGPATPHRVPARAYAQKSIVYFAVPDHAARLPPMTWPDGLPRTDPTVGQWLKERVKRSRY